MQIVRLTLPTPDPAAVAGHYRDILQLPVEQSADETRLRIGTTALTFARGQASGSAHLAFTVPTGRFDAARAWLETRVTPFKGSDGPVFEGPSAWNSRSVYFPGPDGSVLELIEHRDLKPSTRTGLFNSAELLRVSEVGLAVPDVMSAVARAADAGLRPYGGAPGERFAAVGTVEGLLILVPAGRAWMPTRDWYAQPQRTVAGLAGAQDFVVGEHVIETVDALQR